MNIQKTGRFSWSLWFDKDRRTLSLSASKKAWSPRLQFHENGGRRRNKDKCFDCSLIIGTWVFGYTNWDLQGSPAKSKEGPSLRTTNRMPKANPYKCEVCGHQLAYVHAPCVNKDCVEYLAGLPSAMR